MHEGARKIRTSQVKTFRQYGNPERQAKIHCQYWAWGNLPNKVNLNLSFMTSWWAVDVSQSPRPAQISTGDHHKDEILIGYTLKSGMCERKSKLAHRWRTVLQIVTDWLNTTIWMVRYLFFFFSGNSFLEVKLTYDKLHTFKVYNLMFWHICIHSWNYYHNQDNELIHCLLSS